MKIEKNKVVKSFKLDKVVSDFIEYQDNKIDFVNSAIRIIINMKKTKSKAEILRSLERQDLKKFYFNIYLLHDETYTYCSKGSSPINYKDLLMVSDKDTTIESIKNLLDWNIESF